MSYLAAKISPDLEPHNYKATCFSGDRALYGRQVLAKLEKMESKIATMKEQQEDVSEMEAAYVSIKASVNELKFSTHLGWLKLKKAIDGGLSDIEKKYKARKISLT